MVIIITIILYSTIAVSLLMLEIKEVLDLINSTLFTIQLLYSCAEKDVGGGKFLCNNLESKDQRFLDET